MVQLFILELLASYKTIDNLRSCFPAGLQLIEPGIHTARIRLTAQDNLVASPHKGLDLPVCHRRAVGCNTSGLDTVSVADRLEFCRSAETVDNCCQRLAVVQLRDPVSLTPRVRSAAQHGLIQDFHCVGIAQVLALELNAGHKLLNNLSCSLPSGNQLVVPVLQSVWIRLTTQNNLVATGHKSLDLVGRFIRFIRIRRISGVRWVGGISGGGRIGRVCGIGRISRIDRSNPILWLD